MMRLLGRARTLSSRARPLLGAGCAAAFTGAGCIAASSPPTHCWSWSSGEKANDGTTSPPLDRSIVAARGTSIHKMKSTAIDESDVPLSQYSGKPVLIISVAGASGLAADKLFAAISCWHQAFGAKLQILLFPTQQSALALSKKELAAFVASKGLPTTGPCKLMGKVPIEGDKADPLWKLASTAFPSTGSRAELRSPGIFLFDKQGHPVGRFFASNLTELRRALDTEVRA